MVPWIGLVLEKFSQINWALAIQTNAVKKKFRPEYTLVLSTPVLQLHPLSEDLNIRIREIYFRESEKYKSKDQRNTKKFRPEYTLVPSTPVSHPWEPAQSSSHSQTLRKWKTTHGSTGRGKRDTKQSARNIFEYSNTIVRNTFSDIYLYLSDTKYL